jgi:hypothetical protein
MGHAPERVAHLFCLKKIPQPFSAKTCVRLSISKYREIFGDGLVREACTIPAFQTLDNDCALPCDTLHRVKFLAARAQPSPTSKSRLSVQPKREWHLSARAAARSVGRNLSPHKRCRGHEGLHHVALAVARQTRSATTQTENDRAYRVSREIGPADCRDRKRRHREELVWIRCQTKYRSSPSRDDSNSH